MRFSPLFFRVPTILCGESGEDNGFLSYSMLLHPQKLRLAIWESRTLCTDLRIFCRFLLQRAGFGVQSFDSGEAVLHGRVQADGGFLNPNWTSWLAPKGFRPGTAQPQGENSVRAIVVFDNIARTLVWSKTLVVDSTWQGAFSAL